MTRRADDGKEFNDSTAWGYCDYCAFMVAVFDGKRVEHKRFRNSGDESICNGSGGDPLADVPYASAARQMTSLKKDPGRAKARAYWQRDRWRSREKRRRLEVQPTKLVITSLETGEETDLTPFITGPVVLDPEESE